MNAEEAAQAAGIIKPKIAITIHYGLIVGTGADAENFKRLVKCAVRGLLLAKSYPFHLLSNFG